MCLFLCVQRQTLWARYCWRRALTALLVTTTRFTFFSPKEARSRPPTRARPRSPELRVFARSESTYYFQRQHFTFSVSNWFMRTGSWLLDFFLYHFDVSHCGFIHSQRFFRRHCCQADVPADLQWHILFPSCYYSLSFPLISFYLEPHFTCNQQLRSRLHAKQPFFHTAAACSGKGKCTISWSYAAAVYLPSVSMQRDS